MIAISILFLAESFRNVILILECTSWEYARHQHLGWPTNDSRFVPQVRYLRDFAHLRKGYFPLTFFANHLTNYCENYKQDIQNLLYHIKDI